MRHRTFANLDEPRFGALFGGPGGTRFDDAVVGGDEIAALWIAAGRVIDSVQIGYRNGHRTSRHGGTGGAGRWTMLGAGELVIGIGGRCDRLVERLVIRTTHRTLGAGGASGQGRPFLMFAPEGHHIIGLHGASGVYLDRVGARFAPLPGPRHLPAELARDELRRMGRVRFGAPSPDEMDDA